MDNLPILSFFYSLDEIKLLEKVEKNFQCLGYVINDYICGESLEKINLQSKNVDDNEILLPIISDSFLKSTNCFDDFMKYLDNSPKALPILLDVSNYGKNNNFQEYLELKVPEKSRAKVFQGKKIHCISLDDLTQEHYQTVFTALGIPQAEIPPKLIKINKLRNPETQESGLEELLEEYPNNRSILYGCAFLHYENENIESSRRFLEKLLSLFPKDAMGNYLYASLLRKHFRNFENTKKAFETSIASYPNFYKTHYEYAVFLQNDLKHYEQAKLEYKTALQLNPNNSLANYYYALFLVEKFREYESAKKYFENCLRIDSNFVDAHYNYALVLVELKDFGVAREHYETAIKLKSNFVYAHNNYAYLLETQFQEYDKAKKHYEFAIKLNPNFAYAHFNYALFLYEQEKNFTEAKKHYLTACKLQANLKNQEIDDLFNL